MPEPPKLGGLLLTGCPASEIDSELDGSKRFLVTGHKATAKVDVIGFDRRYYDIVETKLVGTPESVATESHVVVGEPKFEDQDINESVTYYAAFKSDPEVFVTVAATDGKGDALTGKGAGKCVAGTITGAGKYAPGKKVTLKATANKGYVFNGWYEGEGLGGLVTQAASYSFSMPSNDVSFTTKFVTAEEDKASIGATVDGLALEPWVSKTETQALETNVWAGVYLEWPVAASALSETTVKVAGLPGGLKFTAKPVTSKVGSGKTAVTVTNVAANTIYGAPSAASKTAKAKDGLATLLPTVGEDGETRYLVFVYLVPKGLPPHARCMEIE